MDCDQWRCAMLLAPGAAASLTGKATPPCCWSTALTPPASFRGLDVPRCCAAATRRRLARWRAEQRRQAPSAQARLYAAAGPEHALTGQLGPAQRRIAGWETGRMKRVRGMRCDRHGYDSSPGGRVGLDPGRVCAWSHPLGSMHSDAECALRCILIDACFSASASADIRAHFPRRPVAGRSPTACCMLER